MSRGGDDNLNCILEGPVSDKVVAMTESPQLTTRLLAEPATPAPINDACSTTELPPREGRTGGGGPCQGPCRPLTDALPLPHPFIISHVNNACILFAPAKIYIRKKLRIDAVSLKMRKFIPLCRMQLRSQLLHDVRTIC